MIGHIERIFTFLTDFEKVKNLVSRITSGTAKRLLKQNKLTNDFKKQAIDKQRSMESLDGSSQ
jgi:hypothetical protein